MINFTKRVLGEDGRTLENFDGVNDEKENGDKVTLTLGGNYDINDTTDIYARLTTKIFHNIRSHILGIDSKKEEDNKHFKKFGSLVFGVDHKLSLNNKSLPLSFFSELVVAKIYASNFIYGKEARIGFNTYLIMEPVKLSLTAGYDYRASRHSNKKDIDPGDSIFINPNFIYFINNKVTATVGVNFIFERKTKLTDFNENIRKGIPISHTDFDFGINYRASRDITIKFTTSADISGNSGTISMFKIAHTY